MSRSYAYRPTIKKHSRVSSSRASRKVQLTDYEIEFIQLNLGPSIRLDA